MPKETVESLLDRLCPSAASYRRYLRRAENFLAAFAGPLAASTSPKQSITALRMRKSLLFGRKYLVAYADSSWFRDTFPGTNAIAAERVELGSIVTPPLVFVPNVKNDAGGPASRAVLEHEFVHVNQMIQGTFPALPRGSARELRRGIFRMARAEYEANMIQLTRWPQFYKPAREKYGLSLQAWCILRGFTQALEHIVHAAAKGSVDGEEFLAFLDGLPRALPMGFKRLGFGETLGREYATKAERYALTAFLKLIKDFPSLRSSLPESLRGWIRSRRQQAIRMVESGAFS